MTKRTCAISIFLVLLIGFFCLYADDRQPYDIVLVVDKSLSMEEEIGVVKNFVRDSIIDETVQIGDNLVLIDFYGQAELLASIPINSQTDIDRAKQILASISLNQLHTYTDIGNAVDLAQVEIEKLGASERPKIIFVVTDGIQEAPPGSKYVAVDGTFSHALLEKASTIAKEGWKIQVIAIGSSAATKEFTERISGEYVEVSEEPTEAELELTVEEFEGIMTISQRPERLAIPATRENSLGFKLKSQGFKNDAVVTLKEIRLTTPVTQEYNVLNEPLTFTVPKEGEQDVAVKVNFPPVLAEGDYNADFQFIFDKGATFTPGIISLTLHVNTFFENNPLLLVLLIAGGVLLLALLIFLIVKIITSRGVRFRLKVEEAPLKAGKDVFKVSYGKWLYLNESYGRLSIIPKRSLRSIGRVYGIKGGLEFEPLREEQFVGLKKAKQNVLGQKITVKTQDSAILHVEFVKL